MVRSLQKQGAGKQPLCGQGRVQMLIVRGHGAKEVDDHHLYIEPLEPKRTVNPQPITELEVKGPESMAIK